MPRGGNNGGYKNSPVIGNNGLTFEDDEEKQLMIRNSIENARRWFNVPLVKDDDEAIERLKDYTDGCMARGLRPTVEGLAMCLGTTRSSLWDWETGKHRGPVSSDIIKKAKEMIAMFDADMVSRGKLNPVTYIFRSKNYYGMKDQQDIVVTPKQDVDINTLIEEAELLPDDDE